MKPLDKDKAAWIAGIIDGEGYISWNPASGQAYVQVGMTDKDIIDRLLDWSGVGQVFQLKVSEDRKPAWRWTVGKADDMLWLMDQVQPYLLSRRSARVDEVRALLAEHKAAVLQRRNESVEAHRSGNCTNCRWCSNANRKENN